MSKCRYDLSEDCHSRDCLNCVLDKIIAEIERIEICGQIDDHSAFIRSGENVKTMALDIIDKYKAESEDKE